MKVVAQAHLSAEPIGQLSDGGPRSKKVSPVEKKSIHIHHLIEKAAANGQHSSWSVDVCEFDDHEQGCQSGGDRQELDDLGVAG